MFEKNLADVIRGLRANKKNEEKYINIVLEEIRKELKTNDIDIKAQAIAKLTYVIFWNNPLHTIPVVESAKNKVQLLTMLLLRALWSRVEKGIAGKDPVFLAH